MRAAGLRVIVPAEELGVMGAPQALSTPAPLLSDDALLAATRVHLGAGLVELVPHLPRLSAALHAAEAAAVQFRPHAVVTVDYKARTVLLQRRRPRPPSGLNPHAAHNAPLRPRRGGGHGRRASRC